MSRSRVRRIVIISSITVCIAVVGRAADSVAQTIIGDFTGTKLSMVNVAVRLSQSRIPVGIEAAKGLEEPSIDLDLKGATVADVLNAAVRADPRYLWKGSDGVINVLPKAHLDSVFDVRVRGFAAVDEIADQIITNLLNSPSIKEYLARRNMQAGTIVAGSVPLHPAHASLTIKDETLMQALNDVLIRTGSVYWCKFYDRQNGRNVLLLQVW